MSCAKLLAKCLSASRRGAISADSNFTSTSGSALWARFYAAPAAEEASASTSAPASPGQPAATADKREYLRLLQQYNKQRAQWKWQMTQLRKQWMAEHKARQATEVRQCLARSSCHGVMASTLIFDWYSNNLTGTRGAQWASFRKDGCCPRLCSSSAILAPFYRIQLPQRRQYGENVIPRALLHVLSQAEERRKKSRASRAARDATAAEAAALKDLFGKLRAIKDAQLALDVAQDNLAKARRDEMRKEIVGRYRQQEKAVLLEASRGWVAKEELEARVQQALANPAPFSFMPRQLARMEDLDH